MISKMKIGVPALFVLLTVLLATAALVDAQTAARFLGTVTAVNGNTLTVKTDAGEVHEVDVPSTASLKQIGPKPSNSGVWPPETGYWSGWIQTRQPAPPRPCR